MATTAAAQTREKVAERSLRSGSWLMGVAAVGFIGYAVLFLVRNFTDSFLEVGIGPNEVHTGKDAIQQFSPELYHYVSHLHIAVSGFIAATGLAVLFLVAFGVRRGELWAWAGAVAAPVLALVVALPAHYPYNFDTLGHLGPIYLATVIFVVGALLALRGIVTQHRG
jgi:cytochrome bd-type quinol oxidase subunit 2